MIKIEHGTVLLVLTPAEAQLIVQGLDELLNRARKLTKYKQLMDIVNLADYIEERLNEVKNNEIV